MSPRVLNEETQTERENIILDQTLRFVQTEGIAALTIDKLVSELPYSKGTVYNHFTGKEDLLLGLCNRGMSRLAELFELAESYEGNNREQGLAILFAYMLYARLYPTQFMLVITAKSSNLTDKVSPPRNEEHIQLEGKLLNPAANVFRRALDAGEIDPPMALSIEQLAFACWSLVFGTNALLLQDVECCGTRSQLLVEREMINNINLMFDGMRFRPFTNEFDWSKTISNLKKHTYKKEIELLKARGENFAV